MTVFPIISIKPYAKSGSGIAKVSGLRALYRAFLNG
jgi:hypothetical protein